MKLKKWIACATAISLIGLGACSPAADTQAGSISSNQSGTASDNEYSSLDTINLAEYKSSAAAMDFIPEGTNLSGTKPDGTKYKIAWCVHDMADESQAHMTRISRDYAKQYGFELLECDAQADPQKQIDHINQAITQGCDAVVVSPVDAKSTSGAMKKAKEAGVVVVNSQMEVTDSDSFDVYCGPNDTQAGQMAASALMEMLPDGGKVVIIEGFPGSAPQINRDAGFLGVMQKHPEFKILEIQTANWSTADAMNVMESYMSKYPEIDVVYSHFDLATLAAIQAAEGTGRADDIIFLSVDGTQGALDKIAEGGCFKFTAMQDFSLSTELQYLVALAHLNGQGDSLDKMIYVPYICIEQDNAGNFEAGWG